MLYAFVERAVGSVARATPCTRGTTARVWCIETERGRFAVKAHCRGRAFAQERAALTQLAPHADDADDPWPQLVASDPEALALVMTWQDGTPADGAAMDASLYAAAGALRRRFDAVSCTDDDPLPLAEALDRRMGTSLASLDAALAHEVRAHWRAHVFTGATRRFCHRDFAPHNWLVSPAATPRLRCVDFGHARADHPLVDFARALSPVWGVPAFRAAMLAGYGRALANGELEALRQLELVDAVATVAWGRRRGDTALANGGHAAIAAWLADER